MLASVYAPKDFKRLRAAGDIVARCFEFISPHIRAGISTGEIDRMVAAFLKENRADTVAVKKLFSAEVTSKWKSALQYK